jgi:parallel beta-helix repeat protein
LIFQESSYSKLSVSSSGNPYFIEETPQSNNRFNCISGLIQSSEISTKISTNYTVSSPIFIDDISDFGSLNIPGNGTKSNPYRIENLSISHSSGIAIYIQGISANFLIRNNQLNGLNNASIGIQLQSVQNGCIENNTIKNFFENSIKFAHSSNNVVRENIIQDNASIPGFHTSQVWIVESTSNIFEGNIIKNYRFAGAFLISSFSSNNTVRHNEFLLESGNKISLTNCENNIIYNNTVLDIIVSGSSENVFYGNEVYNSLVISSPSANNTVKINNFVNQSQSSDEGIGNIFNYNYWSIHTAEDDHPTDGILDTPYPVSGSPQNEDPYPMANKILDFLTPPNIINPMAEKYVFGNITIEWDPALDFLDQEITYSVFYSNNSGLSWNVITANHSKLFFIWNTIDCPNGDYHIKITAITSDNTSATVISDSSFSIQNHFLTPLSILFPDNGDVLNGRVKIKWLGGEDTLNHQVSYSVYFSIDAGNSWVVLKAGIQSNECIFDTSNYTNKTNCKIRVQATCFEGLTTQISSNGFFRIDNTGNWIETLMISIISIIILLMFVGLVLFLSIHVGKDVLYKMKYGDKTPGLCLGSFSDEGFKIQRITENCPFNEQILQYMIEYTAVMYQTGDYNQIFGPFPQNVEIKSKTTEWLFVSFGFQSKDISVKDPRINKGGGIIPMILLIYYPKRFESVFQNNKKGFSDLLTKEFKTITDISVIVTEKILRVEYNIINMLFPRYERKG